jgi:hypothetical protein
MYVNAFWFGVFATIIVEIVAFIIVVLRTAWRMNRD